MPKQTLENRINRALKEIRPVLAKDQGDIELVQIQDEFVDVRFLGNCKTCPLQSMTLRAGVERIIKKYATEIKRVEKVD